MVPLNLMPPKNKADYISTGSWSKKAIKEAKELEQSTLLQQQKKVKGIKNSSTNSETE
jgi:phosphoserine aminotransferase